MSESVDFQVKQNDSFENTNTEKFLVFTIQDKLYCFPSRYISEIAMFDTVYPLPLLPSYVLGVVNRYSVPYALFDIGLLFYKSPTPRNKVLIFKEKVDKIAIIIDDVTGIADINPDLIVSMERSLDSNDLTEAVSASFNWNDDDVFVLDVFRILNKAAQETV
ncbi:MAG: chemotaxis protein CheW [Treponema sp.]|nr:chemotaxis protein CheW [Treponema sp.]